MRYNMNLLETHRIIYPIHISLKQLSIYFEKKNHRLDPQNMVASFICSFYIEELYITWRYICFFTNIIGYTFFNTIFECYSIIFNMYFWTYVVYVNSVCLVVAFLCKKNKVFVFYLMLCLSFCIFKHTLLWFSLRMLFITIVSH